MCGIPRCGKSSWIRNNKGNSIVVCPDDIRKEIFGHQFHAPANKFVFGIAEGMTALILKQRHNVIVDATHVTSNLRFAWKCIANQCEADIRVVWVYAYKDINKNFAACLERNELSSEGNRLPVEALARMAMHFEAPDPKAEMLEVAEYRNVHRVKLPPEKRVTVDKDDDIFDIAQKWKAIWD